MAHVEIYTTQYCPFCIRAKARLTRKGIAFDEIDVAADPALRQQMTERSGGHTVPQIFIDNTPIGGSDELHQLDADGRLDSLLTPA